MSDRPRKELRALLGPVLPKHWQIITSERAVTQHGTLLRLQQQKIRRHTVGGTGVHELDFAATLTVEGDSLSEEQEDLLDDELTEFVQALDELQLRWTEWSKAIYDGHLGYQSTLTLTAQKEL